jgi:hypothetical protein
MIRRNCAWLLAGGLIALLTGCSHTAISGEGTTQAQVIHGTVGITGEDHRLTILAGSDVTKVSIIGEEIRVIVDDGAVVRKVEIVGEDNEVLCPADLVVEYSAIGEDNRLKRRP